MYIVSTINSATSIVDFKKQRTQKIEIYSKPYKYTIFSTNTQTHIFSFHLQISKLPPTHRTHTHTLETVRHVPRNSHTEKLISVTRVRVRVCIK